ncbi:MAG: hypothetical protein LBL98_02525 [Ruminococcus sp.]|jgi:pilin isopeptide linkage protein|nr:hypothetical protein [Ruminococcus sp.]
MADYNVNSMETLNTALASSDSNININVTGDFSVTKDITIPAGKTVIINGADSLHRLTRGATGDLIKLSDGAALTISNLIIDVNKSKYPDAGGSLIAGNNTRLILKNGVDLIGNRTPNTNGGAINLGNSVITIDQATIADNEAQNGGAIYVPQKELVNLDVSSTVTFSNNKATTGNAEILKPTDIPVHNAHIKTTQFTSPNKYAYNNDDIGYKWKAPNIYSLGDGWDGAQGLDPDNNVTKKIADGSAQTDNQFQFGLFDDNGNQVATGTNTAAGTVTFTPITFVSPGTYNYTVRELPDPTGKYAADKTEYRAAITITDDGKNDNLPLKGSISWEGGKAPVFVNEKAPATVKIQASKQNKSNSSVITGGTFRFNLIENGKIISTVTNNPDGTIVFPDISYNEIGEHDYEMAEVVDNPPKPGWQYDRHYCSVHISVTKDGSGNLAAKVTYNPELNPNFVNTYTYTESPVGIKDKVIAHGKPLTGGEFEFNIVDKNGNIVGKAQNDKDGNIVFPDINLPAGDYSFEVIPPEDSNGWTFDKPSIPVHVGVKDNGNGTSTPEVTYPADPDFNAYYEPAPAQYHVTAHKVINGWTLPEKSDKQFTFVLRNSDGILTRIQGTDGTIDFGEFETRDNTELTIFEEGADGDGWTLDKTLHNVNVTVTDDGSGQLTAAIDRVPTLVNTYKPSQATTGEEGTPKTKKAVSGGKPLEAGQFTFGVFDAQGNLVTTGTNDVNGDIKFPVGYFDKPGEYDYTVKETTPDGGGYTTDKSSYPYKVIVTDNGKGQLVAEIVQPTPEPAFINTYTTEGSEHILAFKSLQGFTTGQTAPTFRFSLKDKDGNIVKEITSSAGTLDFGTLEYIEPGDYEYTVNEEMPLPDGWTIPVNSYRVIVHMTDDGKGGLIAAVDYPDSNNTAPQFVNTYSTLPVNIGSVISGTPKKTATGKAMTNSQFRFGLYDSNGNLVAVGFNNADGSIRFPLFYSSKLGETDYEVKELTSDGGGWSVDKSSYPVKVNITDDGKGHRTAEVTYPNGTPVFDNVYSSDNADADIKGVVIGHGKTPADGEFEFNVVDDKGNIVGTAHNDDNGNIVFPTLNLPDGDYDYRIVAPPNGNGWTFDVPELPVHVNVTDNGDGTSSSIATYPNGDIFNPIYTAIPANVGNIINNNPSGEIPTKTASGGELSDSRFSFALYDENNNIIAMGFNHADGKIHFPLFFSSKVGNTVYTMREVSVDGNGWITDKSAYPVNVNITDNGDGTLSAKVSYPGGIPVFNNIYNNKPVSEKITAGKVVHGWNNTEKQFSFILKDDKGNVIETAQNKDGQIDFGVLDYTEPGTYSYTIEEENPSVGAGWRSDLRTFPVVVTVTRDEHQNLAASVDYPDGTVPIFDNYYAASDSPINITAKKTAVGKNFEAGQFEFQLTNDDGTIILYAKNDGDGNITFSEFNLPIGDYNFTIHEITPDGDNWTTDKNKYLLHISVIDNGDGTTRAEISYPNGAPVFTNTYELAPVTAKIYANKCVCGTELYPNWFNFGLFDSSGTQISSARNDEDGFVSFPAQSFNKAGVYRFFIKELNISGNGWQCDDKTAGVTVTVSDNGQGTLAARVSYDEGTVPVFTNTYNPCF